MLIDPVSLSLAQSSDRVLAQLSGELLFHARPETHAAVVELATGVQADVEGVAREMGSLRKRLSLELSAMGLAGAVAGTHPTAEREETKNSGDERYLGLGASLRALARREPTMALHVHVGVATAEEAVRLLNGLRRSLPVLLALSANSPFWRGCDSGFASVRTMIFQSFPRSGPPRLFAGYADYVEAVNALIGAGAVADPSFFWWDLRLQPALGTVEVRIMDAQSTVQDAAAIIALIQSLAHRELEDGCSSNMPSPEVLAENRFLAARDGMDARLIDAAAQRMVPVQEMLYALLEECRPHALALGCAGSLERVYGLAAANGAARQRDFVAGGGSLDHLVASLSSQFLSSSVHHLNGGRRA